MQLADAGGHIHRVGLSRCVRPYRYDSKRSYLWRTQADADFRIYCSRYLSWVRNCLLSAPQFKALPHPGPLFPLPDVDEARLGE